MRIVRTLAPAATRAALVAALCCACSSSGGSAGPGPAPVIDFDLPAVVQLGGSSLRDPRVQPIYFPGFPYASDIDTFFQRLATSTYWPAVVAEYHVRSLTTLPGYATNLALPATLSNIELSSFLRQALNEGSATLGAPRADTIYALFLGPDSALTMDGQTFCGDGARSANHDEVIITDAMAHETHVAMAYFPSCPTSSASSTLTGVDVLTPSVSREIVNAATDPLVYSSSAYGDIGYPHTLWEVAMNPEAGGLCENERPNLITPPDIGHPVQRIWSNASAKAGAGPCVPVPPGEAYFNAVAALPAQADYYDRLHGMYALPAMDAQVGLPVSAQISFRGGPTTPSPLTAVAFELDDASSLSVEQPTEVMGGPGETIAAPVATSAPMKTGLMPLVIRTTDAAHTAVHFWIGGINRN
jgi:hypothetical protein